MLIILIFVLIMGMFFALFLFYHLWFLRDPIRTIPTGNNLVSPADGKVSKIVHMKKGNVPNTLQIHKGLLGKIQARVKPILGNQSGYLISIVMTPMDVHYQYAPCDAIVSSVKHHKGKFLNAVTGAAGMAATLENEHTEIILNSKQGNISVFPIAGFVARRIHTFIQKGQTVKKGDKLGIIKLGSQVSIVIPEQIIPEQKIKVKEGQKVYGGQTIIAEY